jgi:2-polyprenyl-6-hydroxyphenyl methylase/3-demethylubiquinone-9 3-methyltransferase
MGRNPGRAVAVNNDIYFGLGEHWYAEEESPVSLLRAESKLESPWITSRLDEAFGPRPCRVLDVGCGAGFLSNDIALAVAHAHDVSGRVRYVEGDALALPFEDRSFDAVCAMDLLEHLETPERAIAEASRVLAPGGLFFFHTFNRNVLAWLIVIAGVKWFVRNTPEHMHVLRLFLKPRQVRAACVAHGLEEPELIGVRPRLTLPFWKMLLTGRVGREFAFTFTRSTSVAYSGVARKRA